MTDPNFRIETERLVLTHLQSSVPSHCDFMVKLWNTKEFIASIGGKPTSITTTEAARKLIENRFQAEYARNGYGTYLVSLKSPPGNESSEAISPPPSEEEPIGTVSLTRGAPPTAYSAPDLGFAILPDYMRKGYAREAATGLLAWAESELHVYDVLGLCDPANEGSNGLFRSLGFVDRGVRTLKVFGNVQGAVWVRPGMAEDLSVYGL